MTETTNATRTITRDEYRQMVRNDYAGPVSQRLPETVQTWAELYPAWDGQHWGMWFDNGTVLGPINVR